MVTIVFLVQRRIQSQQHTYTRYMCDRTVLNGQQFNI